MMLLTRVHGVCGMFSMMVASILLCGSEGSHDGVNLTNYYGQQRNFFQFIPCKLDGSSFDCKCAAPYSNRHARKPGNDPKNDAWDPRDGDTFTESKDGFYWIVPSANCGFNKLKEAPGSQMKAQNFWPGQSVLRALYLFKNEMHSLTWVQRGTVRSQFDEMPFLEILNMRSNVLNIINKITFQDLKALVELNLEDNEIRVLPEGIFDGNANLTYLRLGSNKLETLPSGTGGGGGVFRYAVALKILRLENNVITSLPKDVFKTSTTEWLPNLKEIYLTQNLLTELKSGMFDGLELDYLYVQLNKISLVDGNFFARSHKFTKSLLNAGTHVEQSRHPLSMDGNPSSCFIRNDDYDNIVTDNKRRCFVGGDPDARFDDRGEWLDADTRSGLVSECADPNSTCYCNLGYENRFNGVDGASVAACEPVRCSTPPDLAALNALQDKTSPCFSNKTFQDTCVAQCQVGYAGASGTYTCGADGEWIGSITCIPGNCDAEVSSAVGNYKLDCRVTGSTFGAECVAECDVGHETVLSTKFECECRSVGNTTQCDWVNADPAFKCQAKDCGSQIKSLERETTPRSDGIRLVDYVGAASCIGDTTFGGDSCFVKCASAQPVSNPNIEFTCADNGLWIPVNGVGITCVGVKCNDDPTTSEIDVTAEARCRGDRSQFKDPCVVNCKAGYISSLHPNKPANCNGKGGNGYGDECLECLAVDVAGEKIGRWNTSVLKCERVSCSVDMAVLTVEDSHIGDNLDQNVSCVDHLYGDLCTLNCTYGHIPSSTSMNMLCDANAGGYGTWLRPGGSQEPVGCKVFDCGDLNDFLKTSNADADLKVLTSGCNTESEGGQYFDPIQGVCTNNNTWDAISPATRTLRCDLNDAFGDEFEAVCTPNGWTVPSPTRTVTFPTKMCRKKCGTSIYPDVKGNGGVVVTSTDGLTAKLTQATPSNFKEATCANDGVGDSCNITCNVRDDLEPYVFDCIAPTTGTKGTWTQVSTTVQDSATLCVPALTVQSSTTINESAVAAMIIVPLIVIILVIIVLLYYFECLTCLGLQANKKRPGTKRAPMTANPAYAPASPLPKKQNSKKEKKKKEEQESTIINGSSAPDFQNADKTYSASGFNIPMAF
eukprot:m.54466 g.54466  ORF g.54466 m.54466 type:complete len:1113 (+) comp21918_c0_seq1:256-3594(+)